MDIFFPTLYAMKDIFSSVGVFIRKNIFLSKSVCKMYIFLKSPFPTHSAQKLNGRPPNKGCVILKHVTNFSPLLNL